MSGVGRLRGVGVRERMGIEMGGGRGRVKDMEGGVMKRSGGRGGGRGTRNREGFGFAREGEEEEGKR
jgi:hypothetical protein